MANLIPRQDFEGTGAPGGWSSDASSGGTVDFDYDAAALSGGKSLYLDAETNTAITVSPPVFSASSTVDVFFKLKVAAYPASTNTPIFTIVDAADDNILTLRVSSGNTRLKLYHGSVLGSGPTDMVSGTLYNVWIDYTKGAGSDGVANLYYSTTETKPVSPNLSVLTGDATTDAVGALFLAENRGHEPVIFDDFIAESVIGDSGPGAAGPSAPTISNVSGNNAGETVTITVDSYDTVSSVTYNGVSLSNITEATATTITATMPLGGQAYGSSNEFVVTDANGASSGFAADFNPPTGFGYFTLATLSTDSPFYGESIAASWVTDDQIAYETTSTGTTDTPSGYAVSFDSEGLLTVTGYTTDPEDIYIDFHWLDASSSYTASTPDDTLQIISPFVDTVSTPTISPNGGSHVDSVEITLSTATAGASIYYTTDGSTPDNTDNLYSAPFTITSSATIKAIGILTDYDDSNVATALFTVQPQVATPSISPNGGTHSESVEITLSTATADSSIFYTTDGIDPDQDSTEYVSPFTLTDDATVKAVAVKGGYFDSEIESAAFTVTPTVATPTVSPNGGYFETSQEITLACSTPSASIYYTTDGSTPDNTDNLYSSPFTVTDTTTVKAIAVLTDYNDSLVRTVTFTKGTAPSGSGGVVGSGVGRCIGRVFGSVFSSFVGSGSAVETSVSDPGFAPSSGNIEYDETVAISSATSGATIYYTTNGDTPTTGSTEYTAPISLSAGTYTIKALAVKSGLTDSNVTSQEFTFFDEPTFQVFPAPTDVATAYASDRYTMTVSQDGVTPVDTFVMMSENDNPVSANTLLYMQDANHFTKFRTDDPVTITISMIDNTPITSCVIRPLELGITPAIDGDTVSFVLPAPHFISVEINETYSKTASYTDIGSVTKEICKHPLLVFAAPLETDIPDPGDVTWYEPGIHSIGLNNALPNDTHIYLEGWAVLVGGYDTTQANPSNIKIHGNGVITGQTSSSTSLTNTGEGWVDHAIALAAIGEASGGTNNVISGITISAPMRSCIVSYNAIDISWVSMMSWQHRRDGITAGDGSSSSGEIFIKSQDDNLKVYYPDQDHQAHFIIWQQTSGSPAKFGWNLSSVVQNVYFDKITMIHSDVFYDIDPDETDEQLLNSTSAFFSCMGINTGGNIQDVVYNEIVIEEEHLLRLIGLRLETTHEGETWGNPDNEIVITGIQVKSLTMPAPPVKKGFMYANAGGSIADLLFENVVIDGEIISAYDMMPSVNDGIGMTLMDDGLGGTVSGIVFSPRNFTELDGSADYYDIGSSITADSIVMDVFPTSGNTGLPTGAPAVTNGELQTISYTLTGGNIQYIGRNGSSYFDGYITNVKIYNGSTLLVDSPLDEDWATGKARNRVAVKTIESSVTPDTVTSPWVDNGDGSYTIDGSQAGNANLYYNDYLATSHDYLAIITVSGSSAGGVRPYSSEINSETVTSGNGTFEYPFSIASNIDINIQANADFDGTVTFEILDVTTAPAYLTAVSIDTAELMYFDTDASPDEWHNLGDTISLPISS